MDVLRARGGYDLLPGPGDPNQAGTGGSGLALPLLANKFGRVSYARNNFRAPGVPMHNIGYLAAFLTTFAFLPQAIKTIRTRDTAGVSLLMYASMTMGIVFWLLHGIHLGDYALIGANSVTLFLAVPILVIVAGNVLAERRRLGAAAEASRQLDRSL
jgi:MtN3 and saliva related transmembrane protein